MGTLNITATPRRGRRRTLRKVKTFVKIMRIQYA
jgi:hypothetical protein